MLASVVALPLINSTNLFSRAIVHPLLSIILKIILNKKIMNSSSQEASSWSTQATRGSSVSSTERSQDGWDDTIDQKGNFYIPDPPKKPEPPHSHEQEALKYFSAIVRQAKAAKAAKEHSYHDPQKACDCDKTKLHTGAKLLEQTWKLDPNVKTAASDLLRMEQERNDLRRRRMFLNTKRSIYDKVFLEILDCRLFDIESIDDATLKRWGRSVHKARVDMECAEDNLEQHAQDFWIRFGENFEDKPTLGDDIQEWFLKRAPEHREQAAVDTEVMNIFLQRMKEPGKYMEEEAE